MLLLKAKLAGEEENQDEDETDSENDHEDDAVCYVETANLDGESNLKQRYAIRAFANQHIEEIDFNFVVDCEKPNMCLHKFNGVITYTDGRRQRIAVNKDNLLLRDCVVKNTNYVEGLVIYAGHETKAMLNNKGPRLKQSRLEKMMNGDIVWCIMILVVMCTVSALGHKFWLDQFSSGRRHVIPFLTTDISAPLPALEFLWNFFTFMILFQMIIPISLYVCIEGVKLGQVFNIHHDRELHDQTNHKRVECRALNITEDLGQVEFMFCDKTGTLTENMMNFRSATINGIDYRHESVGASNMSYEQSNKLFSIKFFY